jgi:hyaluronan synthase
VTTYSRRADHAITVLAIAALAAWGYLHARTILHTNLLTNPREIDYLAAYLLLVWQTVLLAAQPRWSVTKRQQRYLDSLSILIPVPVRNEDPAILRRALRSLIEQTRRPDIIHVVDNDSDDPLADYTQARTWFLGACERAGIHGVWETVDWKGKRLVHGHVARAHQADIYLTVDSDGVLDPRAVEELLLPFASPRVQSVAGLVMAENDRDNVLARILDLWFLSIQLVGRASQSRLGAVTVNSGPLAAYRFAVVRENVDGYLGETFLGRAVHFSDDSMLTLYALTRGRAVQNPHAIVLVAMPNNLSHHVRQFLRWMRGSTIRSLWRFRYLRMSGYAYWSNLLNWVQLLASVSVLVDLFVIAPAEGHTVPWTDSALIASGIGYGFTARYLGVRRADEPSWSRILTWLLAPLAVLWSYTALRFMRWYGVATCRNTGWGTRERIEIFAGPTPLPPASAALEIEAGDRV